jgi:capsular polysaccharide biosynthesis protein
MTADTPPAPVPEISLVEAVWRYRLMSVLVVLACGLASVGVTQLLLGGTQATARFAVTDPTNTNSLHMGVVSGAGYATYTAQRAAFAQSAPVLKRAAEIIVSGNGPHFTLEALRASVHTASKPDGGVVEVVASGSSMAIAATTANAVVQSYQELTTQAISGRRDAQLKAINNAERKVAAELAIARGRDAALLAANLAKLQTQESQLLADDSGGNDGVQFVDQADPTASAPSKLPQNAVIGLAVGVLVACVASFLRASAPTRSGGSGQSWIGRSEGSPKPGPDRPATQTEEAERASRQAAQAEWASLARQAERAELAERARQAMKAEQALKAELDRKAEEAKRADLALQADLVPRSEREAARHGLPVEPEAEEWATPEENAPWLESAVKAGSGTLDGGDEEDRPESESASQSLRTSRLMHYYDADR